MKNSVYKLIQDRFIDRLEDGQIPWAKPWSATGVMPTNGLTGRTYSGVNVLLLGMMPYTQPYWLTFNQAKKAGGNVISGESSTPVTFWNMFYKDSKTGETLTKKEAKKLKRDADKAGRVETIPCLKYYNVFNIEQCENLDESKIQQVEPETHEWEPIEQAAEIWKNMPDRPDLIHGGGHAYYAPADDIIQLPEQEQFTTAEGYYKTLFHEAVHSTGADHRIGRKLTTVNMDKKSYSKEELTAEIGASFLTHAAGIFEPMFENSVAYVNGWLDALRHEDNEKMIIHAAARAQKAADFILDRNQNEDN